MSDEPALRGELQTEVMRVLWDAGPGTAEEVRSRLPGARRRAFNTVQTVLNRLATRGLVRREPGKKPARYSASMSEAEYVGYWIRHTLRTASPAARAAALDEILRSLERGELHDSRG